MKWLTLFTFFCASFTLQAQESPVAYSVNGKVQYSPASKGWFNFAPLKTGTPISPDGRLKLKSGASVSILFDEQYTNLAKPGKHALSDVLVNYENFKESRYTELLQERVEEASDPFFFYLDDEPGLAANTKPTKPKYESKEGDGHGEGNAKLRPITVNGGKVSGKSCHLSWAPVNGLEAPSNYTVRITDDQGKVLMEETASSGEMTLNTSKANMTPGKFYRWQAADSENADVSTPNITFELVEESELESTLAAVKSDPAYQAAEPAARLLLEAVALEKNGFQERAGLSFKAAMDEDPEHDLARALYKAFLWRQGL